MTHPSSTRSSHPARKLLAAPGNYCASHVNIGKGDFNTMTSSLRTGGFNLTNKRPTNLKGPLEKMNGLYNLSRQLVATNTLDTLLENIVRHSLDLLQVGYSRILTLEPNGTFTCKAAYPPPFKPARRHDDCPEPAPAGRVYKRILQEEGPLMLDRNHPSISPSEAHALGLDNGYGLCLVPMKVDAEPVGILALGKERKNGNRLLSIENLRLAVILADQAASAIYRARLFDRLESSNIEMVLALSKMLEARDSYTSSHSRKLTDLAAQLANRLDYHEVDSQTLAWAAMLHDIGKIAIPDEILHRPGPLTSEEWLIVKRHPEIGAEIVLMVPDLVQVAFLIRLHHERFDGSGYPYGLKAEEIPLGARILAVLDSFSAITDGRPYRPPRTTAEAIIELKRCAGSDFDPRVVEAFVFLLEEQAWGETGLQ